MIITTQEVILQLTKAFFTVNDVNSPVNYILSPPVYILDTLVTGISLRIPRVIRKVFWILVSNISGVSLRKIYYLITSVG